MKDQILNTYALNYCIFLLQEAFLIDPGFLCISLGLITLTVVGIPCSWPWVLLFSLGPHLSTHLGMGDIQDPLSKGSAVWLLDVLHALSLLPGKITRGMLG